MPGETRSAELPPVRLALVASISPSEDPEKVLRAAKNVLGDCTQEVEASADELRLSSTDTRCLRRIHDQLRDRRVRDAARRSMLKAREGDTFTLLLNRQAAHAGLIVLCAPYEDSPLGPLVLRMTCEDPDSLLDWLTLH